MNYLGEHNKRKEAVVSLLGKVADYYQRLQDEDKVAALRKLQDDTRNGKFSIVVVGQFSAGKSTFLNALMGDRYLPSFTTETTATINVLRSVKESPSGRPMVSVAYMDGRMETSDSVDVKTIEKFVSVKGDNVAQNVECVDVYFDSPYLNDGVCLVDSPGLNGVLEGHKDITDRQIKKSHAAIFMFNAAQPGSASDFRILQQLRNQCDSIIIVLNRIDEIKTSEQSVEDVIAKLKESYMANVEGATTLPEIWPIAAYPALVRRSKQNLDYRGKTEHSESEKEDYLKNSRMEAFEERLMRYLTQGEKTKKELEAPVDKIMKFLEGTRAGLEEEITVLQSNTESEEIENDINSLNEEIEQLDSKLESSSVEINTKIHDMLRDAQNSIKSQTRDIKEKYLGKIGAQSEMEELGVNSRMYVNTLASEYDDVYKSVAEDLDAEFKDLLMSQFSTIAQEVEARVNASAKGNRSVSIGRIELDESMFEDDSNIDSYLEERRRLKASINKIDDSRDDVEAQIVKEQSYDEERKRLEAKIERAHEYGQESLTNLGPRPVVTIITHTKMQKGGNWFYHKYTPYTEQESDDSAGERWDQERANLMRANRQNIEELEAQLDSIPRSNVEEFELRKRQLERKRRESERELEELDVRMREDVERQKKKKVRAAKAYLESRIEECEKNGRDLVIKQLKEQEDNMTVTAKEIIKTSLEDVLKEKRSKMQTLLETLSASKEEKEKAIAEKQALKTEAFDFLNEAEDLKDDLGNVKVDRIEVEDL